MKRLLLLVALVTMLALSGGAGSIDILNAQAHPGPGCELHYSIVTVYTPFGAYTYLDTRWECHGP